MTQRKRLGVSLHEVVNYTLPKYHEGKDCYVDFLCFDPVSGDMKRKKFMLNSIGKKSERRKRAAEIISNVSSKLRKGWNPWADATTDRQFTQFNTVMDTWTMYLDKLKASGSLKPKTHQDYTSRLGIFREFNEGKPTPIKYIYQLDQGFVSDFLDYVLLDRDVSARTRNNYRTWISVLSEWLIEKKYITTNPVEGIRILKEDEKFRSALPPSELARLKEYLYETDKSFLLACMMEYYTFIRPDELSNIRISDISLKDQRVFVSSTISKNSRDGMVGLNTTVIHLMLELGIFNSPGNCYLFGRHFLPAEKKADSRIFREKFAKIRTQLGWPMQYQFYSLKDSGIRDLANAEGIVIARDQARHSDISTTNRYLKGDSLSVHEETKHFKGNF